MEKRRVIQAGHLLAIVFVALLLVGGRSFLGDHPVLSGLLLAAFAPVYYFAARITAYRQFLYPAILLIVFGFHLLLHGAGLPLADQPLLGLIPLALIYLAASREVPRAIEGAAHSFYGSINLLIAVYAAWILFRMPWFYTQAALGTALALGGYGLYAWLRFERTEKPIYAIGTVALASGGYFFFLYGFAHLAMVLAAMAALRLVSELFERDVLRPLETFVFALVGAYLLLVGLTGARPSQLPLGYLALSMVWLHLGLALYRPQRALGSMPQPAMLPRLLPLFGGGIVLGLLPIGLFYPWQPLTVAISFLTIFFVVFLATARELATNSLSLIGVILTRVLSALGRLAPVAAFVYLAYAKFPASYRLALASLAIGLLSWLAGWRQVPRVLERRNIYVYQGCVFLTVAYFLAERRLAAAGPLGILFDSGALLVLALIGTGFHLRRRLSQPYIHSLYDVASVAAAAACIIPVVRGPIELGPALILGGLLLAVCAFSYFRVRGPSVVFTLPVVLGYWLYVVEWLAGVRGESLGLPYLIWGFIAALIGYNLLRRGNRWYELFYFMWFLCVMVSLTLFYPYQSVGAYAAPLWPILFVLVARAAATRDDFPFALVIECLSGVLAAASVTVLLLNRLYWPTAIALFLYALAYAWTAVERRLWFYLYAAAVSAVAAYFFGLYSWYGAAWFLPQFWPLAASFYFLAAYLRRRGWQAQAIPFELTANAAILVGALRLVTLPYGVLLAVGCVTGLAYFGLYLLLTRYSRDRAFLAGVGLAGAFTAFELLPALPVVTHANRLGWFIPVALVLALLGRRLQGRREFRGAWGLYAAAIATTVLASLFALWPAPASTGTSRLVLMVAMAVWLVLLLWTRQEIFVYCGTLALAMLAYNFVQSSADLFGQHLVAFFLYGTVVLGLIFLAAVTRNFVRFRRPVLFVPREHLYQRLLYLFPIALLGVAVFGSWGVTTSSNPIFCGTCHNMNVYFASWKGSAHARANVGCDACHYEPGLRGYVKAKLQGTSELVTTLTGAQASKPMAAIPNQTCLREGCHSTGQLAQPLHPRGVYHFNHSVHLTGLRRGPDLRCTSCHTDVGPETHFAVDTNACFTCHFQAASEPRPATAVGCVACHGVPAGARGASGFDHAAAAIPASDPTCESCHAGVTRGSTVVEERQCRHCHVERTAGLLARGSAVIHRRHVSERGVNCDWCHATIRHTRAVDRVGLN